MRQRAAAAALIAAGLLAPPASAEVTPLFVIPTETETTEAIPAGAPLRLRLEAVDAALLARTVGSSVKPDSKLIEITLAAYPQLRASIDRTWREATFVIDFDQPAFETLAVEMKSLGAHPTPAQIVEYVNRIVDESIARRWDFASVVARRRQGDCTEHAVLVAALLRRHGYAARVTLGLALTTDGEKFGAFGHAWAETSEEGRWVVADAALHGMPGVRYLPFGILEEEGPGFALGILELTKAWVSRVTVLGPG